MTENKAVDAASESVTQKRREGARQGKRSISKYLTFRIASEEYGLEILKVVEIIGLMDITRVPRTPGFVRGVINLRGKIIPVVELRTKFGMESTEDTDQTCIIVVQILQGNSQVVMGIIVDQVSEVLDIDSDQIEDTPSFGVTSDTNYILGIGKVEEKVIMLLDIDKVLTTAEVDVVRQVHRLHGTGKEEGKCC